MLQINNYLNKILQRQSLMLFFFNNYNIKIKKYTLLLIILCITKTNKRMGKRKLYDFSIISKYYEQLTVK